MKKYACIAAMLVLTAAVLAGCRNPDNGMTTAPSQAVTMPSIAPTTPATQPAPRPSTEPTIGEGGTMPSGEGGSTQSTGGVEGRSRMPMTR